MTKKTIITSIGATVLILGLVFLATKNKPVVSPTEKRLSVVTSFYPLYYFTNRIVGDAGTVVNVTPAGAEPHDYELTARDIATIESADLLILNGKLEPWSTDVIDSLVQRGRPFLTVTDGMTLQEFTDEDGSLSTDPHIWLSPRLAAAVVEKIVSSLSQIDPSQAAVFRNNSDSLLGDLHNLDANFVAGLAQCTLHSFVTSHAAFGYVASAYKLQQVPISGLSPDEEPSPKELARVASFVKSNNIKYIFFESLVSPKLSETIAHETGAQSLVLNPIEGLTETDIQAGKSYFTEMDSNLQNLRKALECQ